MPSHHATRKPKIKALNKGVCIISALSLSTYWDDLCVAYSISRIVQPETGLWLFAREVDFMRWFPVAFLTDGVFIVTRAGIELTTLVLWLCMLNHYATKPLTWFTIELWIENKPAKAPKVTMHFKVMEKTFPLSWSTQNRCQNHVESLHFFITEIHTSKGILNPRFM